MCQCKHRVSSSSSQVDTSNSGSLRNGKEMATIQPHHVKRGCCLSHNRTECHNNKHDRMQTVVLCSAPLTSSSHPCARCSLISCLVNIQPQAQHNHNHTPRVLRLALPQQVTVLTMHTSVLPRKQVMGQDSFGCVPGHKLQQNIVVSGIVTNQSATHSAHT